MRRTTEQWEALLDGTTPGPWAHDGESGVRGPRETDDLGRGPALLAAMQMPYRQPRKRHNAALMAAAPEAVAEVIRLRKAIAELAAEERATADDEFYPVHLRDLCRAYADDLARILEGGNDE